MRSLSDELNANQQIGLTFSMAEFLGGMSALVSPSFEFSEAKSDSAMHLIERFSESKTQQQHLDTSLAIVREVEKWLVKAGAK